MRMGQLFDCEWFCHGWFAYTDVDSSPKMAQWSLPGIMIITPSLRPLVMTSGASQVKSFHAWEWPNMLSKFLILDAATVISSGHEFSHLSLRVVWPAPTTLFPPDRPSSYRCHLTLVAQPHQKVSGWSGENYQKHGPMKTTRATGRRGDIPIWYESIMLFWYGWVLILFLVIKFNVCSPKIPC